INYILREYLDVFIIVYFNNILVYINGTLEKYVNITKAQGTQAIHLNKKNIFHKKEVKFLGYLIS
ncbi:hypothetical protein K469DRAFT_550090, partial [Zopfia rhizophila CBS 207.26]